MLDAYVHGYSQSEAIRLDRQASILADFIHGPLSYEPGARVLEAGCGTGAQTIQLARRHPSAHIVSLDRSAASIAIATQRLANYRNVRFQIGDITELPFADAAFDAAFVCFVLEHLSDCSRALSELQRVLKPAARIHVVEGDHGSVLAQPDHPAIRRLVVAVSRFQLEQGGNPYVGRALGPILRRAGFADIRVEARVAYADFTRQEWIDGFTRATFIDMMQGQRDHILTAGILSAQDWDEAIEALERTTRGDGTFCYTFFHATATRT
jgi:SAM-dependent methyltransferase